MTTRILEAAAQTVENARMYLAKLPIEDQNMVVENNQIVNLAIPVLFRAQYYLRRDVSRDE